MYRPKSTPGIPRRTLRFKSAPNQSRHPSLTQNQCTRDPLAAVNPYPRYRTQPTARAFGIGATLASLSLLPRRTLLSTARQSRQSWRGRNPPGTLATNFDYVFHQCGAYSDHFQELAASTPQKRNWKGILTAFAMIIFISSIILAAIFFLTPRLSFS
jgi:hypothetical protein